MPLRQTMPSNISNRLVRNNLSQASRFLAMVGFTCFALVLSMMFRDIIADSRFVFYFAAVVLSTWYGGFLTGLASTALSLVLSSIYPTMLIPQAFYSPQIFLQMAIFVAIAFLISYLEEALSKTALELQAAHNQLEVILHGVADGITAQNQQGAFVFTNEASLQIFDYPTLDALQSGGADGFLQRYEVQDENSQPMKGEDLPSSIAFRTGKQAQKTLRLFDTHKNVVRWVIVTCAPVEDRETKSLLSINIIRDITERKWAEEERTKLNALLSFQRQWLHNIIANVPGVIWETTFDAETKTEKLTFINDYVEQLFGYNTHKLMASANFWEYIVHPDSLESTLSRAQAVYQDQESGVLYFRGKHKDGSFLDIEARISANFEDGKPTGARGVMMDISDRVRNEKALARYAQMLQRSNDELQQFAYVASHDLQEPLRMVTSYLQLIEKRYNDRLDDDAREFIGFAVDGAVRMKSLINDLLLYSRVESNDKSFETIDTQVALDKALANLKVAIDDSSATITHDPLPKVCGDEAQISQLWQNLLSNAIKFRGKAPLEIHVSAKQEGELWQFSVKDNGIGIDSAYADRIFVVFQRLHSNAQYPGTGIGLAICKKVVERHGGQIWIESALNEGCTVFFTLPPASAPD